MGSNDHRLTEIFKTSEQQVFNILETVANI